METKEKIKNHFVEINNDKFTKVKVVECKHSFEWKGLELQNKFMITEKWRTHELSMNMDYRHVEEVDNIFFTFNYTNWDDGYAHMSNLQLYLILDEEKTIELKDVSDYNSASQVQRLMDSYITIHIEVGQLSVSVSDFIQIASAGKIDYSIRFGGGKLEGSFSEEQLTILKGFYNATFDEEFEVDRITNYLSELASKPKTVEKATSDGCYVATKVYGSYEHPQVLQLRDLRDNYLAKRKWGSIFISTYYKYSPKLVRHLDGKDLINKGIRNILNMLIRMLK
jgi:flagellar motor switch/type III secretory pathway protein FliN